MSEILKTKPYRNRKLLDLAHRLNLCQFQIPGVCIGYSLPGCEPAHSNESAHGKGVGIKAADDKHIASCMPCHRHYDANMIPKEIRRKVVDQAIARTFAEYKKNDWLKEVGYQ